MMLSMPPERTPKGVCDQSLLFHSLNVYLNNKNRLQPIIGLSCVIECVKAGAREVVYLCEVCKCRLSKNDAKNHIMGSLHRFNYIRVRYPHFVSEWKTNTDLSKMARPLMEMTQILERREGTGNVQVLQLDSATYAERMTTNSESHALTLLHAIRTGQKLKNQSDNPTAPSERHATQSQRIVLPPQKRSVKPEIVVQSQTTAVPFDSHSNVRQDSFQRVSAQSEMDSPNAIVQSEISEEDLHGYTGDEPLIGLTCVVECRSEMEGPPYCFLCRCCDTKATNDDILDHLTNPYHRFNYMMKYHAECLEGMKAGPDISQHLQSAARELEREEGRGQVQVMRLSSSLCSQMVVNSYQWCVDMLKFGFSEVARSGTVKQNREDIPVSETGHDATKVKDQGVSLKRHASMPQQHDPASSRPATEVRRKKKRPVEVQCCEPVFKVSLSLTDGPLLLERTSFSQDPSLEHPPTPDFPPSPSGQPQSISSEVDCGPTPPPSGGLPFLQTADQDTLTDHRQPGEQDGATDGRYFGNGESTTSSGGLANVSVTLNIDRPQLFPDSYSAGEDEGPTNPPLATREGPTEHPYHSGERLASNRYPSREWLTDNRYPSREWLTDNRYPSREWPIDSECRSGERITDGFHREEEKAGDRQYHSGEGQTDRLYHADESTTARRYTEEEELYRSEIQRGVGLRVEVMKAEVEENNRESYSPQQQYYTNQPPLQYHTRHRDYGDAAVLQRRDMDFHTGDPALYDGHMGVYRANASVNMGGVAAEPRLQFYEMRYRAQWEPTQPSPDHFRSGSHGYEAPPNTYPPQPQAHRMTSDPYYAVSDGFGTSPDLNPEPRGHPSYQLYIRAQTQGFGALPGPPVFRTLPDLGRHPEVMSGGFVRPPSQPYFPDPEVGYVDPHFNPTPDHPGALYHGHTSASSPWASPGLPGTNHPTGPQVILMLL